MWTEMGGGKMLPRGTFFIDLDGTLFRHGTTDFLPGAKELLELFKKKNYRIIFMTRRGDAEWSDHPVYSEAATRKMLEKHGLDKYTIIFDVMSPRHFLDDSFIKIHPVDTNQGYTPEELEKWRESI